MTRLCFEVIIRNREGGAGVKMAEEVLKEFDGVKSPIVNLVKLFIEAIKLQDFDLYRQAIGIYKP